jgi:outer membrane lipoprotein-sorting protein
MDKKRKISPIIIAIIVIVAIAAVGIGYILTRGAEPSGDIETATSLSFKVDTTVMGTEYTMTFKGKDIQSPNTKFRIDGTIVDEEFKLIIYTGEEKAWMWMSATGWQDVSATMQPYLEQYLTQFDAYKEELSDWTGGDYTYTDPTTGATVRIYDVVINPDLPDTLFQID